ncbi:hypothetical protein F5Y17DRAFT_165286 [Xylariaceae sp. FL0594]|nr:hypothetical protein F5Y17DRAFT_165286 [Xylariaceae sp. FL0594]
MYLSQFLLAASALAGLAQAAPLPAASKENVEYPSIYPYNSQAVNEERRDTNLDYPSIYPYNSQAVNEEERENAAPQIYGGTRNIVKEEHAPQLYGGTKNIVNEKRGADGHYPPIYPTTTQFVKEERDKEAPQVYTGTKNIMKE